MTVEEITVDQLADDALVLDVREQDEWDAGHVPGAVHIPMSEVPDRVSEVPMVSGALPVICKAGGRSARVAAWLAGNGHSVVNVAGGTGAWAAAGKPMTSENGQDPRVL